MNPSFVFYVKSDTEVFEARIDPLIVFVLGFYIFKSFKSINLSENKQ